MPSGTQIVNEKWIDVTKGELQQPLAVKKFEPLKDLMVIIERATPNYKTGDLQDLLADTCPSLLPASSLGPQDDAEIEDKVDEWIDSWSTLVRPIDVT